MWSFIILMVIMITWIIMILILVDSNRFKSVVYWFRGPIVSSILFVCLGRSSIVSSILFLCLGRSSIVSLISVILLPIVVFFFKRFFKRFLPLFLGSIMPIVLLFILWSYCLPYMTLAPPIWAELASGTQWDLVFELPE